MDVVEFLPIKINTEEDQPDQPEDANSTFSFDEVMKFEETKNVLNEFESNSDNAVEVVKDVIHNLKVSFEESLYKDERNEAENFNNTIDSESEPEEAALDVPELLSLDSLKTECDVPITSSKAIKNASLQFDWKDCLKCVKNSFQCTMCNYKTTFKPYFVKHAKLVHDNTGPLLQCQECLYKTKTKGRLNQHIKLTHNPNIDIYKCKYCSYESKWKYIIRNHVASKHDEQNEGFSCKYCNHVTKWKTNLLKHIKVKHKDKYVSKRPAKNKAAVNLQTLTQIRDDPNYAGFSCLFCDHKTKWRGSMLKHVKLVHDRNSEVYKCNHCEYSTKDKYRLSVHIRHKHDENAAIYQCALCTFKSKEKCRIEQHAAMMHNDAAPMQCLHCNYCTKNRSNLIQHLNITHKNKYKIYQCPKCSFSTKWQGAMIRHNGNMHENCTIYQCSVCSYKTKNKCKLDKHMKRRHKIEVAE